MGALYIKPRYKLFRGIFIPHPHHRVVSSENTLDVVMAGKYVSSPDEKTAKASSLFENGTNLKLETSLGVQLRVV